ncbi:hypothetical protein BCV70DRAFT_201987 [Testicularia cyperi]|uniref:Thiamin pyrophosphokinase thiamin-binding domain-containing protein n=1 Tax=Testicularia cyperi TaxID=1882483 RepID=A0A317XK17_9BASI|nr:hypothetical protein BCV70DRAFT_201987 [Testicularia cyperi]
MTPPRMSLRFLGTSSMPNSTRNYSSLLFKVDQHTVMIDCGESTQRQLQSRYVGGDERLTNIRTILVTHLHADHVLGIVPMLMSMLGPGPTDPSASQSSQARIEIFGPKGLRALIRTTLTLCYSQLSDKYVVHEFVWPSAEHIPKEQPHCLLDQLSRPIPQLPPHDAELETGRDIFIDAHSFSWPRFHSFQASQHSPRIHISAAPISHRCPTLGYVFEEEASSSPVSSAVIDLIKQNGPQLLATRGIRHPLSLLSTLVGKRQSLELPDGSQLHPPPLDIPGRKVTVLGDTKDGTGGFTQAQLELGYGLPALAIDTDVLVHESTNIALPGHLNRNGKADTFEGVAERAASRGHSVPQVAGQFAALVRAKRLILNHFSTKYPSPPHYLLDTSGVRATDDVEESSGQPRSGSQLGEPERKALVIKEFERQAHVAWREAVGPAASSSFETFASFDGFLFEVPPNAPQPGWQDAIVTSPFKRPLEAVASKTAGESTIKTSAAIWDPSPYLLRSANVSSPVGKVPPHAIILLNSPIDEVQRGHFVRLWESAALRLCADGAANRLLDAFGRDAFVSSARKDAMSLPHSILGDLDSIRPDVQAFFEQLGVKVHKRPSQYATDLQKCVQEVEDTEMTISDEQDLTLIIYGGLAGRLDQSIHTLHVLWQLAPGVVDLGGVEDPGSKDERGGKLRKRRRTFAIGDGSVAWLLPAGKHKLRMAREVMGKTCGILPLSVGTEGARVSTKGLEWNLDGQVTTLGGFLSTSNHVQDEEGRVELETDQPVYWTVELKPRRTA